jgi:mannose-6-phosphate isomerase-like protein (cupin superfamily)/CDGSH-type Zn-finger protein
MVDEPSHNARGPVISRPCPYLAVLQAGRSYLWCRCGRSTRQPYCDGSHHGTGIEPLRYVAAVDGQEVLFCGCKQTGEAPFCDGTHTNLPGGSPLDDANSAANQAIREVDRDAQPITRLDGDCYVVSSARSLTQARGRLRFGSIISDQYAASRYTQTYLSLSFGSSEPAAFGDRHVILLVASGSGTVTICGKQFEIMPTDGIYIRPNEVFQLDNSSSEAPLDVFALASPAGEMSWSAGMTYNFDDLFPHRVVSWDKTGGRDAGPRHYQFLVDKRLGSTLITQFIGHIPRSKNAPHRHLYEEALVVLSGEGIMWTESLKCRVTAGDVIFLPQKQLHSLEATSADGLDVVGVTSPGDNPSINYYD